MRRCDRHLSQENDPYREFNFEKSLRKYEVCPYKKIKKDTNSLSKTIHTQHQSQQQNYTRINKNQEKQALNELPLKDNTQLLDVQEKIKQSNDKKEHVEQPFLKLQGPKISYLQEKIEQKSQNLSLFQVVNIQIQNQDFEVDQGLKKQTFKVINQVPENNERVVVSSRQVTNTPQILKNESQQHFQMPKSSPKEQFQQYSKVSEIKAKNYGQKQGRLYLTENISVSLRSINKWKQSGIRKEEIIENLLKRTNFSKEQKVQISSKLDEFLEISQ